MGCNCKRANKMHKLLSPNNNDGKKTTFKLPWDMTKNYFTRTIQGVLVFVVLTILFPVIIVYLFISYIISGSYSIYIPNFLSRKM